MQANRQNPHVSSINRRLTFYVLVLMLLVSASCSTTPQPDAAQTSSRPAETVQTSLWGTVYMLAETNLWGMPQFWRHRDTNHFAWVDSADSSLYGLQGTQPNAQKLALTTTQPHLLTAHDGAGNSAHLLWMDAFSAGENRLYAALISDDLEIIRNAPAISDQSTYSYSAVENGDGQIWVVWSGGNRPETGLYIQTIDAAGRFRLPEQMIGDGDFPYLMRYADGRIALYWIRPSTQTVYRSLLANGEIIENQNLGIQIKTERGYALTHFQAAADRTHDYLIWTTSSGSETQSWYSSTPRDTPLAWHTPQKFQFKTTELAVETGFNNGSVFEVEADSTASSLSWANALRGEWDSVAVAGRRGNTLTLVYLRNGALYGAQDILPVNAPMIEFPQLQADRDRHLYLTWSELNLSTGTTHLKFTSTRSD